MPASNFSTNTAIQVEDHCTCGDPASFLSFSSTQLSSTLSSTQQDDVSIEEVVVHGGDTPHEGRMEMEELEQRLDEMMRERVQQALQLQVLRDQFNEMAPVFGYRFMPPATTTLKFIGIAYWSFFVVRFLCMADMNLLICLLGSVSLICMTFAFATEQTLFFWPFAFVSLLETLNSCIQFISLSMMIRRSKDIGAFMGEAMKHEDLFGNSVLDGMQTWKGVGIVESYVCIKLIVFPIAFMICAQVARIFYDKEEVLQAQEANMEIHHQRMTELIHRLEILRRT